MDSEKNNYDPGRVWWSWGWQGWWAVLRGSDEFCNRTIAVRLLPPWGALVINRERYMKRTVCETVCGSCPLDTANES